MAERRTPAKKAPGKKAAPRKAPAKKPASPRGKRVAGHAAAAKGVTDADRSAAAEQMGNVVPIKAGDRRRGSGPRGSNSATTPEAIRLHERRVTAMNLRRLGNTWEQVAQTVKDQHPDAPPGYTAAEAYRDVKALLDAVTVEAVHDVRNEDLAILLSLQRTAYVRALAGDDPVWMDKMLKILDTRAKYLGLYAPQRVALAGPGGGPVQLTAASPEEVFAAAQAQLDSLLPQLPAPELPGPS